MAVPATTTRPDRKGSTAGAGKRARSDGGGAPRDRGTAIEREQRLSELGLAFRRMFRTFNRLRGRDTHLGGTELSHAQFQLLIELHDRGELPTGELAAAAELAPGTVTQMLDALVHAGHVERDRSGLDRRVVVTRLTPLGRLAIEAKRQAWQARWQAALEGVSERELRAAANVLERLASMFEHAPESACERASGEPAQPADRGTKAH
jgi:DNA-binding MarR family transcriptional regulator